MEQTPSASKKFATAHSSRSCVTIFAQPATSPYPEPEEFASRSSHPTSFMSILILLSHLSQGLPCGVSVKCAHKNRMHFSFSPYVPHALPIAFFFELITRIMCCEPRKSCSSLHCRFTQCHKVEFPRRCR